jgi:arginase family enzyme
MAEDRLNLPFYTNVLQTFDDITTDVRRIPDAGACPVVIGGDHAVTYPLVPAFTRRLAAGLAMTEPREE